MASNNGLGSIIAIQNVTITLVFMRVFISLASFVSTRKKSVPGFKGGVSNCAEEKREDLT